MLFVLTVRPHQVGHRRPRRRFCHAGRAANCETIHEFRNGFFEECRFSDESYKDRLKVAPLYILAI
jgi:hypothetical protein